MDELTYLTNFRMALFLDEWLVNCTTLILLIMGIAGWNYLLMTIAIVFWGANVFGLITQRLNLNRLRGDAGVSDDWLLWPILRSWR